MNAGVQICYTIILLDNVKDINLDLLKMCFAYGKRLGIGQWRGSGGYGTMETEIVDVCDQDGAPIKK
jgi:hypothetical protein